MTDERHAALLEDLRPAAFAIAYRMLGSVAEAEDVVQEALLRLHAALERGRADRVAAGLRGDGDHPTVHRRAALGAVRRETYVGEWLPEPLVTDPSDDPARQAEMSDSLSLAFLVLLESLSPEQRAAFLLHDVFGYGYGEVAEIVGKDEDNARQLAARARRHVDEGRPRFEASREQRDELARRFFAAARDGEVDGAAGAARRRRRAARRRRREGRRPWAAPSTARAAWRARSPPGPARLRASQASRFGMVDVNGQPGALSLRRRRQRDQRDDRRHRRRPRSRRSARS